jgi:site-specific recombinase XerD
MYQKIKEYLAWKGTYAYRASINYRIWLERFVKVCGEKRLEKYDIPDLVKYRKWLESHFGSYSVQYATVIIKNFLQYCKTQGYVCLAPSLVKLPRMSAKSHRAVSEIEYDRLVATIPKNEIKCIRDFTLIRMLWDTGVRVSELCDLDLAQIDENKRSAVIQTKKNGKKRIIVWSEETHRLLMKYMSLRMELKKSSSASALFVGCDYRCSRLTSRSIERLIKFYVEKAGIKEKITPHSFRHGWAHKRRDLNAPLAFIQRGLGHSNPVSTFVYEQYNDLEFEKYASSYLKAE